MKAEIEDDNSCPVCYTAFSEGEVAILEECTHRFCLRCITEWSNLKLICPLCKVSYKSAIKCSDTGTTIIEFDKPKGQLYQETFDCFDERYFLSEISKLKMYLEDSMHLILSHRDFTLSNGKREETLSPILYASKIESDIYGIEFSITNGFQIDNEALLVELHRLDHCIRELRKGRIPSGVVLEEEKRKVYGADDYDLVDDWSDEYEEYEYPEMYHIR